MQDTKAIQRNMLSHYIVLAFAVLSIRSTLAAPFPQDDAPFIDPGPLPHYPANLRDTSDHSYPFHVRVSYATEEYEGHDIQSCDPPAPPPAKYGSAPNVKDSTKPVDTACVDPSLDSPILAFELRDGTLYIRDNDPSGYPDQYMDTGAIAALKTYRTSNVTTPEEFDTQSLNFSQAADDSSDETHETVKSASTKWALQATGLQGQGLYQLVNEAWAGKTSPSGSPWAVGWLLCGPTQGMRKEMRWYEVAQSPVPQDQLLLAGCEIVSLVTDLPLPGQ